MYRIRKTDRTLSGQGFQGVILFCNNMPTWRIDRSFWGGDKDVAGNHIPEFRGAEAVLRDGAGRSGANAGSESP
jgi:hypothetical protein